jgi:hypothetical protein
MREFLDQ